MPAYLRSRAAFAVKPIPLLSLLAFLFSGAPTLSAAQPAAPQSQPSAYAGQPSASAGEPAASADPAFLAGLRERAPAFRLDDMDGKPFDLGESLGRDVILLDFWATFCLPCLAELNAFKDLQNRRGKGFRVVAVSVDQPQTLARARAFAKGRAFPFTVVADPGQEAYRLYGVSALPTSLLIDARGRIAYRQEGFQAGE